jgi:hypothetical protein
MKQSEILDHVIQLVEYFKTKKDNGELSAGEASIYLKCLSVLGAREAVMSLQQMDSLSNGMDVLELPFEPKYLQKR